MLVFLSRKPILLLSAVAAILVAVLVLHNLPPGTRIEAEDGAQPVRSRVPAAAIVCSVGEATPVVAPFELAPAPSSAAGYCVLLRDGHGDKSRCAGRVSLFFKVEHAGVFRLWLRCRWSNGCGNSVAVSIDGTRPVVCGQDAVYDLWHWIEAPTLFELTAGPRTLVLQEREDGIAVDQALLCPRDEQFVPVGGIGGPGKSQGAGVGTRLFADSFNRSPGHGNTNWQFSSGEWRIAFSLDPNRVPYQYSLRASAVGDEWGQALLRGAPWRGVRLNVRVSVVSGSPVLGAFFRGGEESVAALVAPPGPPPVPMKNTALCVARHRLMPGQWYDLEVLRWAWSASLRLDGTEIARCDTLPMAGCGVPGLCVKNGVVVFDDVRITEVLWHAEDGGDFRMQWRPSPGAAWYRPREANADWALAGHRGRLVWGAEEAGVREAVLELARPDDLDRLVLPGFTRVPGEPAGPVVFTCSEPGELGIEAKGDCRIRRLAVRLAGTRHEELFHIGPYTFDTAKIPDPADYLDFTPEEYRRIRESPDAERLIRKPKFVSLVGASGQYSIWAREQGYWAVQDGRLFGAGRDAMLRFWQEMEGPVVLDFRVRLAGVDCVGGVLLGEEGGQGTALNVAVVGNHTVPAGPCALLPAAEKWCHLRVRLSSEQLAWQVNGGNARKIPIQRGEGGGVLLVVRRGKVDFDDIVLSVPRMTGCAGRRSCFYAFDRREPDWLRRGKWIDHGGISCALASDWVSLEQPEGEGMLVNKRRFGPDVLAAFNVEENSEWFGWEHNPTHVHHPFDNVCVVFATDANLKKGYRLEVNSRGRTETVLLRNGVPVASMPQDRRFPIQYRGGHAPYNPRRNRIRLVRHGAMLHAVVDGKEVLHFVDPDPMETPVVAVGGYRTQINFGRILIRELPPRSSKK